jgi:hypothetical protein
LHGTQCQKIGHAALCEVKGKQATTRGQALENKNLKRVIRKHGVMYKGCLDGAVISPRNPNISKFALRTGVER